MTSELKSYKLIPLKESVGHNIPGNAASLIRYLACRLQQKQQDLALESLSDNYLTEHVTITHTLYY